MFKERLGEVEVLAITKCVPVLTPETISTIDWISLVWGINTDNVFVTKVARSTVEIAFIAKSETALSSTV